MEPLEIGVYTCLGDGSSFTLKNYGTTAEPTFDATELANHLGLKHLSQAMASVEADWKRMMVLPTAGGPQRKAVVNEEGFYQLLLQSKRPEAKEFRTWALQTLKKIRLEGEYKLREDRELLAEALSKAAWDRHQLLLRMYGTAGPCVYVAAVQEGDHDVIKIGSTDRLPARTRDLATRFGFCMLLHAFSVDFARRFEQQHLHKLPEFVERQVFAVNGVPTQEVMRMDASFTLADLVKVIDGAKKGFMASTQHRGKQELIDSQTAFLDKLLQYEEKTGMTYDQIFTPPPQPVVINGVKPASRPCQQYTADLQWVADHTSIQMAVNELGHNNRKAVEDALKYDCLADGFRFIKVAPGVKGPQGDIPPTKPHPTEREGKRKLQLGIVAELDLAGDNIVDVHKGKREAGEAFGKSGDTIRYHMQRGSRLPGTGARFQMYDDCNQEMRDAFVAAHGPFVSSVSNNSKRILQLHPGTGALIREWLTRSQAAFKYQTSAKTLLTKAASGEVFCNSIWKIPE